VCWEFYVFGGGMKITPTADPFNGRLEVNKHFAELRALSFLEFESNFSDTRALSSVLEKQGAVVFL
jgi:hypothetical protein